MPTSSVEGRVGLLEMGPVGKGTCKNVKEGDEQVAIPGKKKKGSKIITMIRKGSSRNLAPSINSSLPSGGRKEKKVL